MSIGARAQPDTIDIVIADDHAIFVDALHAIFSREDRIRVVGSADNGDDLLALVRRHGPDVAIVDISAPGPGPRDIAATLAREAAPTKVIVLTMHLELGLAEALLSVASLSTTAPAATTFQVFAFMRGGMTA